MAHEANRDAGAEPTKLSMRSFHYLGCLCLAGFSALAHEEAVITVGRSAAGEVMVDSDYAQPLELPVSIFPGISGFATGELGVHSTVFDDPTNDFFQLSAAADFRLILLAKDPGMEIWNDTGTGYMATNEIFYVGVSPFDTHPIWNLVNGTPGNAYSLTLKFRDLNGIYPDSAPFVVSFTAEQVHYSIQLKPVDPQHAALLWTTNAVGWELQSATALTTTNWAALTNEPAVVGTNFSLSIGTQAAQQFFRLHKP